MSIAGIFDYIFSSSTKRTYKKGIEALNENNLDLAEQYFTQISGEYDDAKCELDKITFKRAEIAERAGDLKKAHDYYASIKAINPTAGEKVVEIHFKWGIDAKRKGDIEAAYNYFTNIADKSIKAFQEASIIDFNRGLTAELSKNYSKAKDFYNKSSSFTNDDKIHYGSLCRKQICEVKGGRLPSPNDIKAICNSPVDSKLKRDFLYRYAVKKIKSKQFADASEFIHSNFDTAKETRILFTAIENYKKSQILAIVREINTVLAAQEYETDALKNLYRKIGENKHIIDEFPDYTDKIQDVSKNIFGKLMHQLLLEENFEECFDLIVAYPKFYESPELMKNAAICSIRLAFNNKISEHNYRRIVPIWLTAIHNDELFIKSLENTTWDDEYTFTIKNSIGKYGSFLYDRDWDNINQDAPTDSNIDIGNSQRELLNLFESSINAIADDGISNKIHSFYEEEKKAITSLIQFMGYDTLHATPEFANQFPVREDILKHLDWRYEKKPNEKLLQIGAKYINLVIVDGGVKLQTDYNFEKYASSVHYKNLALKHVSNRAAQQLSSSVFQSVLERFPSISEDFEEKATSIIRGFIAKNESDESLISLTEKTLTIIPSSEKLKFILADYTTNFCIDKINEKAISETHALELLVRAIVVCPEHHRTAKNLAVFIGMNIIGEDKFIRKLKELLPSLTINSESLYSSLKEELHPIRSKLSGLLKQQNVNYTKVRDLIDLIDKLIEVTEPIDSDNDDDDFEIDDLPF